MLCQPTVDTVYDESERVKVKMPISLIPCCRLLLVPYVSTVGGAGWETHPCKVAQSSESSCFA